MAIGYAVVVPYAVWMNDYAAVAYPLADGAPQLLSARSGCDAGASLNCLARQR